MTTSDDQAALLKALKIEDLDQFKINTMEVLGMLVLMGHWLRGMFTWLHFTEAVKYQSEEQLKNYQRLNHNLELYEEIIWRIVPPRAMLQQMRLLREKGYLDEDFVKLLEADNLGRSDLHDLKIDEIIQHGKVVEGRNDIPWR